ncbi:hypothetical protein DER44DRAFT_895050 [Fusarium oxysporum]|nr:hypothetical protein DER44DRAFT_895050 [Fusarium oxysporum]
MSSISLLQDDDGYGTPLHIAVFCDNLEAATLLLDAGADPLAPASGTDDRATALTIAGREGKQPFLYQLLNHIKPPQNSHVYNDLQYCFLESAAWGQVACVANLMDWWDGWTIETKQLALNYAA